VNAATRAAARGVGAGVSFNRRARPAFASSRPAQTRGGLGAGARAAERPARPAERSAPQFGAGIRHEARRPQTVAAAAAETAPRAAAARARARPGLAATADEAAPAVRETARSAVSADLFASSADASTSSADAADTTSASPRIDVRRRDGRRAEEADQADRAAADAAAARTTTESGGASETESAIRVGALREKTESATDVLEDVPRFRERDAVAVGTDGATVPETDDGSAADLAVAVGTDGATVPDTDEGLAADLAVATNGASSDADVPGDVPEEPFADLPDATPTSSLTDAYVSDAAATDPAVVPASRPPADTADAAETEVPAASVSAAVTSGARDQTEGFDLGTGVGAGTGVEAEAGTSSPETPSMTAPMNEDIADPQQEDFQEASSFSPPSDGSSSAREKADRGSGSTATGFAETNAATGTAAPVGPARQSPYFGGGRDFGREYAPRGFVGGGVRREPECGSKKQASSKQASSSSSSLDRRYIVRFRENVTDTRFFELKREIETGSRYQSRNNRNIPRLRAAAPGFRVAVLGGVTRAEKRSFRATHAGEIEKVELDAEVMAFSNFFENGTIARRRPVYDAREDSEKTPHLSAPRPPATAAAAALRLRASCAALAQGALTAAQWNLDRVSAPAGAAGTRRSRLDGAFAAPECLCGRGVDVFVVDTGARTSHSEFRGRVGGGANFVDPAPSACDGSGTSAEVSGDVHDDSGHGTHVAGTALGSTSGVAKCATLRPVRILDGDGKGKSSSILEALDWIAARVSENGGRRSVVSMSLGGPRSGAVDDAVAEMAERHGVPVIVAAGNEARDASDTSPAGAGAAVAVGSTSCYPDAETKTKTKTKTNAEDARAERGASSERCVTDVVSPFSNHGDVVRVYAPGHGVRSAWNAGDDAFEKSSGTSMAAPLVAGAAALYLEKYPTAKPSDVARALTTTATAVTWDDGREEIGGGGGMLDLEAMLRVAPG
jgi:hypothetical protein